MSLRYVQALAILLSALGLSMFAYKVSVLELPLRADASRPAWTIESSVRFDAGPGAIKAELKVPALTPGFATLSENTVSPGYGFSYEYTSEARVARWAKRRASGEQHLYYRVVVYADPSIEESDTTPPFPPIPDLGEPENTAARVLIREVSDQSADATSFVSMLLAKVNSAEPDENVALLFASNSNGVRKVERLTELLAFARIPSRVTRGLLLADEQRYASVNTYLEIHDGVNWIYYNTTTGATG